MKSINTLVDDIYELLASGSFQIDADRLASMLARRLSEAKTSTSLRMSNFGTPCERKLWYSVNVPQTAEPLSPQARLKFLIGDIIEEVVITLARQAGHSVEGEQDERRLGGVKGHLDGIIDGVVVDVKSANARGFRKFADHRLATDDPFGYLAQLGMYLDASQDDPRVGAKRQAAFLAVDKELGHIVLDQYILPKRDWETEIEAKKEMLANPKPPPRHYMPEPDGKSGNMKLCMECSYCPYKKECWPGVKGYAYSNKPTWLTTVVREPNVPRIY